MISLRRNVLIFHQAALGDFVLTWPIALAAARLWPTQRILYVTAPDKGRLAERAIGIEWRDADALHTLFGESPDLSPSAQKLLAGAQLIVSFLSDSRDRWALNIRALFPEAELITVLPRPQTAFDRHLSLFHAEQIGSNPQLQGAVGQMLRHAAANAITGSVGRSEQIVIHPGSGGVRKRWSARGFADVATRLRAAGHAVSIVLGEVEREQFSAADVALLAAAAPVVSPPTLVDLFELIQTARLYIGNDSGPTHLAAVAGRPTLALFGPSDPTVWHPLGPAVRLLRREGLDSLTVDEVLHAAFECLSQFTAPVHSSPSDE